MEFTLIDPASFRVGLEARGLTLVHTRNYPVPGGEFWAAIFTWTLAPAPSTAFR